ncbi:alpha/beta fold hydrolase [Ralstonia solanacearum]|uniref:alpha/beta fold hydrolase n=1 Tax=Ralstonia solanacearum TaxID=305 RepID=UPI001F09521B|nr:alpha/beta hydrolase [Ralstonia solanacearum]
MAAPFLERQTLNVSGKRRITRFPAGVLLLGRRGPRADSRESRAAESHSNTMHDHMGTRDDSHRDTNPTSLREYIPQAEMIRFDDCGHFPDIEQPERYASVLIERIARHT